MEKPFNLFIYSFSYKNPVSFEFLPNGGGYVFDCRCVKNPGREEYYITMDGRDPEVISYLSGLEEITVFFSYIQKMVELTVEAYRRKGYNSLSVGFGCTGGQHRSVFFSEKLKSIYIGLPGYSVELVHYQLNENNVRKRT